MNLGGDAADQIVKYSMEGLEAGGKLAFDGADKILRLSGRGAQHLAAFFYAVLTDNKKSMGRTRVVRMLKENKPLKFFTVPQNRLKEFCEEGKKRGLLYVIIKDKKDPETCEIMVYADDAAKVNRVMDKMNLDFTAAESGQLTHEVADEVIQDMPVRTETVQTPEGEIQFEIFDSEQDFNFDIPETGNFTQAQEEDARSPSEPFLRSSGTSTGQEKTEKPSVREELKEIKEEQKEKQKQNQSRKKQRGKNRSTGSRKKKAKTKGR